MACPARRVTSDQRKFLEDRIRIQAERKIVLWPGPFQSPRARLRCVRPVLLQGLSVLPAADRMSILERFIDTCPHQPVVRPSRGRLCPKTAGRVARAASSMEV